MREFDYQITPKHSSPNATATFQVKRKNVLHDNRQKFSKTGTAQLNAANYFSAPGISTLTGKTTSKQAMVQRVPFWKKALTGVASLGGAAALTAGVITSAPALAIAGGAALAGGLLYGGYKSYHEYSRNSTHLAVQNELAAYDPANNPNVGLNAAATGRSQTAFISPPGLAPGVAGPAGPLANRRYRIDINPDDPTDEGVTDADIIASARTHEKTHIANDQRYDSNLTRQTGELPTNISTAEEAAVAAPGSRISVIESRVNALKQTVKNDRQVPKQWREYIYNRLDYIVKGINPLQEYDTVINELLHFMYAKNIEADSATAQAITRMAKENLQRRA